MSKIKILTICTLSAIAAAMAACSESPENFESKARININSKTTNYLIRPDMTEYTASLNVAVARPATQELEFTFSAEESLVDYYNQFFYADAVALPSEFYSLSNDKVRITKGAVQSEYINVEFTNTDQLESGKVYVLPVTIAQASGIEVLESARTHYYIFKEGAIINWAANITYRNFPITWADNSLVNSMTELTIESMLYINEIERDGSDSNIMSFFGVEGHFLIRLGDTYEAGQVMVVTPTGNQPANANSRIKVPVGEWFHLAVTIEATGDVKIYLNGEYKSNSPTTPRTLNLATNCFIGKSWNDNRWWPGMICETRLWNTVRTQEELANFMYSVPADSEGLIAYWKFDEGNGNTVTDRTVNGNHITCESNDQNEEDLVWVSVSIPE